MIVFFAICVILGIYMLDRSGDTPQNSASLVVEIDDALSEEEISIMKEYVESLDGIDEALYIPSVEEYQNARYFLIRSKMASEQTELQGRLKIVPGVTAVEIQSDILTEQDFWDFYPYRIRQLKIPCESIAIFSSDIVLTEISQKASISVLCTPQNTTDSLLFRSKDESVALVSSDGAVTAIDEGETEIEITCGSVCAQVPVSVKVQKAEPLVEEESEEVSVNIQIPPENELFGTEDFLKVNSETNLFAILPEQFTYSGGAGGWRTKIVIHEDGSFVGNFSDYDLGVTGPDYPDGTCRISNFTGTFSVPKKISDYVYSLGVSSLNYSRDIDVSWIENGMRYVRAKPAGFVDVTNFRLYLPGCSLDMFTDDQLSFAGLPREMGGIPQGMFALYAENKEELLGFWGSYENCLMNQVYEYQYENRRSELRALSYTNKSSLVFWPEEGAVTISLDFLWNDVLQRKYTAVDEKSGEPYELELYPKKDLESVYVVLRSKTGISLEPWGGTADGVLAATYTCVREEQEDEKTIDKAFLKVGESVTFGHYEQDNNLENGEEPIRWKVLSVDQNEKKALLISQYALDTKVYHYGTTYPGWGISDIRNWLNIAFYDTAFSASEQKQIRQTQIATDGNTTIDSVFLLSGAEVEKYMSGSKEKRAASTAYTQNTGAYTDDDGYSWWWLRPTLEGSYEHYISVVNSNGILAQGYDIGASDGSVRPAIWVAVPDSMARETSDTDVMDIAATDLIDENASNLTIRQMFAARPDVYPDERENVHYNIHGSDYEGVIGKRDIDADGKTDVLYRTAVEHEGHYEIRFGNGKTLAIEATDIGATNYLLFCFEDLNGTGKEDIVVCNSNVNTAGVNRECVAVYLDIATSDGAYKITILPNVTLKMKEYGNGMVQVFCPEMSYSEIQIFGTLDDQNFEMCYGQSKDAEGFIKACGIRDVIACDNSIVIYYDFGIYSASHTQPMGIRLHYSDAAQGFEVNSVGSDLIRRYWLSA